VAPPLLSLPFAFAALGWTAGIICLVIGAAVTFYSYNLISRVLEHHAQQGRRQLRFRDMATDILGQFATVLIHIQRHYFSIASHYSLHVLLITDGD
jgi:amino acid permease